MSLPAIEALLQGTLVRDYLKPRLKAAAMTQAALARTLGVTPPSLNQFLLGVVPPIHILSVSEAIGLTETEAVEFSYVNDVVRFTALLFRAVVTNSKNSADDSVFAHLHRPGQIFERLVRYAAKLAEQDATAYADPSIYRRLRSHMSAAVRVINDVDLFLSGDASGVLTDSNIHTQLRYPANYYMGFLLTEITKDDGSDVVTMQEEIITSLLVSSEDIKSQNFVFNLIAQHAIHLLTRFRIDACDTNLRNLVENKHTDTKRMALFGGTFGESGDSMVEQLSESIMNDNEFSKAVIAFDGFHYGDYKNYKSAENASIVPENAFMRQLSSITSSNEIMRQIAAVRIIRLLEKYASPLLERKNVQEAIKSAAKRLDLIAMNTPEQERARALLYDAAEICLRTNQDERAR